MRTTLTLDPEVAERLKLEALKSQQSFKQVVNLALKRGLKMEPPSRQRSFRVKPHSSAYKIGVDPLHLNRLSDELETESWIEKQRHQAD